MAQALLFRSNGRLAQTDLQLRTSCTLEDHVEGDRSVVTFQFEGRVSPTPRGGRADGGGLASFQVGIAPQYRVVRTPSEKFSCTVRLEFWNPAELTVSSSTLSGYGLCVVGNVAGILAEAANKAYEAVKPQGKNAYCPPNELLPKIVSHIIEQRIEVRGKVFGALLKCVPFGPLIGAVI